LIQRTDRALRRAAGDACASRSLPGRSATQIETQPGLLRPAAAEELDGAGSRAARPVPPLGPKLNLSEAGLHLPALRPARESVRAGQGSIGGRGPDGRPEKPAGRMGAGHCHRCAQPTLQAPEDFGGGFGQAERRATDHRTRRRFAGGVPEGLRRESEEAPTRLDAKAYAASNVMVRRCVVLVQRSVPHHRASRSSWPHTRQPTIALDARPQPSRPAPPVVSLETGPTKPFPPRSRTVAQFSDVARIHRICGCLDRSASSREARAPVMEERGTQCMSDDAPQRQKQRSKASVAAASPANRDRGTTRASRSRPLSRPRPASSRCRTGCGALDANTPRQSPPSPRRPGRSPSHLPSTPACGSLLTVNTMGS
jgi:hypothetical protein